MQQPSSFTAASLESLSTQELEVLGTQLNAAMQAQSYAYMQYEPTEDHRSLALLQQWQAAQSSDTQEKEA
jgi:hypothetical protein